MKSDWVFQWILIGIIVLSFSLMIAAVLLKAPCEEYRVFYIPEENPSVTFQPGALPGSIDYQGGLQVGGGIGLKPGYAGYFTTRCVDYGPTRWIWQD